MARVTFIHAADLHLGAGITGVALSDPGVERQLATARGTALDRLVELAITEEVDFVLLSGDIFDTTGASAPVWLSFRKRLMDLERHGIAVYCVAGNHDPAPSWPSRFSLPDNTFLFPSGSWKMKLHQRHGEVVAAIAGTSFQIAAQRQCLLGGLDVHGLFGQAPMDAARICLLHANIGGRPGHEPYSPCSLSQLTALDVDYWALGHMHSSQILSRTPAVVYPGSLVPRSRREGGLHGCMVVRIEDREIVEIRQEALSPIAFGHLALSLTGVPDEGRLMELLRQEVQAMEAEWAVLVHLTLTGRCSWYGHLSDLLGQGGFLELATEMLQDLRPPRAIVAVQNETEAALDLDAMALREDLAGYAMRQWQGLRQEEGLETVRVLAEELTSSPTFSRFLRIGQRELASCLDEAAFELAWRLDPREGE